MPTETAIPATAPKSECEIVCLVERYARGPTSADTKSKSAIVPANITPNTNHHGRRGKIPRANANDASACVAGSTTRVSTKKQSYWQLSRVERATSAPLAQSKIPLEAAPTALHPVGRRQDSHPAARTPAYPLSRNARLLPCAGCPSTESADNSNISDRSASSAPSLRIDLQKDPPGP